MNLPEVFTRYRAEIDAGLRAALRGRKSPLYDMMRYHLGWADDKGNPLPESGGKALRPTLCLLACQSLGGDYRRAIPAAAAIELAHNYSLIHDDIQDDDKERRHRPTVWSIWGKPQAINAGTAMRLLASLALADLRERGVSDETRLRIQRLLDEDCLALIEGQYLDISYETMFNITVSDYLDMIEKKTAALIACALEAGALLASENEAVIAGYRRAGRNLGMAFQIRDDILGIWGDERQTGKPSCSDIIKKKKSMPIIYALENTRGEMRTRLQRIYGNGASPDTAAVLEILDAVGARHQAQRLAEGYSNEAMAGINALPLREASRRDLTEVLSFLIERDF